MPISRPPRDLVEFRANPSRTARGTRLTAQDGEFEIGLAFVARTLPISNS